MIIIKNIDSILQIDPKQIRHFSIEDKSDDISKYSKLHVNNHFYFKFCFELQNGVKKEICLFKNQYWPLNINLHRNQKIEAFDINTTCTGKILHHLLGKVHELMLDNQDDLKLEIAQFPMHYYLSNNKLNNVVIQEDLKSVKRQIIVDTETPLKIFWGIPELENKGLSGSWLPNNDECKLQLSTDPDRNIGAEKFLELLELNLYRNISVEYKSHKLFLTRIFLGGEDNKYVCATFKNAPNPLIEKENILNNN